MYDPPDKYTPADLAEYFQTEGSEYWLYFRIYQISNGSTITFQTDQLTALITGARLRGGQSFQDNIRRPLETN